MEVETTHSNNTENHQEETHLDQTLLELKSNTRRFEEKIELWLQVTLYEMQSVSKKILNKRTSTNNLLYFNHFILMHIWYFLHSVLCYVMRNILY